MSRWPHHRLFNPKPTELGCYNLIYQVWNLLADSEAIGTENERDEQKERGMAVQKSYIGGEKAAVARTRRAQPDTTALVVLCLATVAVFSNMYATQPILPVLGHEFDISPSVAGLSVSVMVQAIAVSAIFYGFLSDRIGRRQVIIGSTLALCVPTLLCALSPNFIFLLVCRVGQGLAIPGFIAITLAYIHEEFPGRRGVAVGWYTTASVMGGFSGRFQGGLMTDFFNWRLAFFSFVVIDVAAGLALWKYLPASQNFFSHTSSTLNKQARRGLAWAGLVACLKNRRLLGAYLLGLCIFFAFIGLFTYLPYYLEGPPFNLSTLLVSFIFVVYLIGMISGPLCGRFSAEVGRFKVMAGGIGLMIGGVGLTWVAWLPIIFAGLLLLCAGMFAVQATTNAFIGDNVGAGQGFGSAVSLYQMFFYVGGSLGGFVPGLLWQSGGWSLVVGSCVGALGLALAAVYWLCR